MIDTRTGAVSGQKGLQAQSASGELEASKQLTEAAEAIQKQPVALQLRYLQTLTEIAAEKNSTILFPLPIEFMRAFMKGEAERQ